MNPEPSLPHPSQVVDTPEGRHLQADMATYQVHDDSLWMRKICSTIGATVERVVVESELKQVLGFRFAKGHRLWRRLRVSEHTLFSPTPRALHLQKIHAL